MQGQKYNPSIDVVVSLFMEKIDVKFQSAPKFNLVLLPWQARCVSSDGYFLHFTAHQDTIAVFIG